MSWVKLKLGLLASGLLTLQSVAVGAAPTASDLNHGLGVEVDTLNDVSTLSWWGATGETYFIQVTADLTAGWEYIDYIYPGVDDALAHGFAVNTDAFFYRLKYTDQPTTDPWNDDFDGDDIGNQDELNQNTDPFAFDDSNGNGIPDDWESFWDDQFAVFPKLIEVELTHGESATKMIYLNDPVAPDADFTVTVTGNVAAAQGAYLTEDSITGTATYNWTEISSLGTTMSLISTSDDAVETIPLNDFNFLLYGVRYDQIFVSSNGQILFGSGDDPHSNLSIPATSSPNAFIAAFWDDLKPATGGSIYYLEDGDVLIVQFESVRRYSGAGEYTFQVVLHRDGRIDLYFKNMTGILDSATIGIESANGQEGIQVAFNEVYVQDLLAVRLTQAPAYFVEVSPLSGTATQGSFSSLAVDFETFELEPGIYQADIEIAHTGTGTTPWTIPAILELTNPPSQIELTAPTDGFTMWSDESVTLSATATDDDFGIERVEFFADEAKQGEDLTGSNYTHNWQPPSLGVYSITARAVDRLGTVSISEPITVTVLEDSDLDRMEDGWELQTFGDLTLEASEDYDLDGFPNIIEYHHGSDAADPASMPQFTGTLSATSPLTDIGEVRYFRVDGVSNSAFEKSTIQAAINAADDFDIIEVMPGIYDESIDLDARVYLFSADGARSTIIDGGARNDRVVDLAAEAVIEGFTIRNGAHSSDGSGLYISEGSSFDKMRIVGCVIRDNQAGEQGGGVYVSNGRPTFVSCTIAANSGGAIYNTSSSNIVTLVNTLLWNPDDLMKQPDKLRASSGITA